MGEDHRPKVEWCVANCCAGRFAINKEERYRKRCTATDGICGHPRAGTAPKEKIAALPDPLTLEDLLRELVREEIADAGN